ncbi:hypothetical protein RND81_09G012400 [Saponaria officinalis]|uniref:Uncharacterized protein n=1 Tax=Saponaria officinalis TaxID=3572 RepID=A0AAW1IGJ1_SAPOF
MQIRSLDNDNVLLLNIGSHYSPKTLSIILNLTPLNVQSLLSVCTTACFVNHKRAIGATNALWDPLAPFIRLSRTQRLLMLHQMSAIWRYRRPMRATGALTQLPIPKVQNTQTLTNSNTLQHPIHVHHKPTAPTTL